MDLSFCSVGGSVLKRPRVVCAVGSHFEKGGSKDQQAAVLLKVVIEIGLPGVCRWFGW